MLRCFGGVNILKNKFFKGRERKSDILIPKPKMKPVSFKTKFKEKKMPLLFDFFRWVAIDIYRAKKYGKNLHLYGIYAFVGIYGGGKTMGMTMYLDSLRKKYGDSIIIATNYYYADEDFHLASWKDMLKTYDKPCIFAYDEIQNEFNSRDYKNFPVSLMGLLSQNRKGHGKQILYTAQDYETVDKNFRRLTKVVVTCRTICNRLTSLRYYLREDYEQLSANVDVKRKMRIKTIRHQYFVQSDLIREKFNSYQFLDSAVNKDYVEQFNNSKMEVL